MAEITTDHRNRMAAIDPPYRIFEFPESRQIGCTDGMVPDMDLLPEIHLVHGIYVPGGATPESIEMSVRKVEAEYGILEDPPTTDWFIKETAKPLASTEIKANITIKALGGMAGHTKFPTAAELKVTHGTYYGGVIYYAGGIADELGVPVWQILGELRQDG